MEAPAATPVTELAESVAALHGARLALLGLVAAALQAINEASPAEEPPEPEARGVVRLCAR